MRTVYASFADVGVAKQAVGALLDKGVKNEHLSLIICKQDSCLREDEERPGAAEGSAKKGITTTTSGDTASGAAKGAGVGLGIGILAALASMVVPGFGLVVGGGALATAIAGAVGATAAGAVSGGTLGYLKDQGVDDQVAEKFAADVDANGALVAVDLWSGELAEADVDAVLRKYRAHNVHVQEPAMAPTV